MMKNINNKNYQIIQHKNYKTIKLHNIKNNYFF